MSAPSQAEPNQLIWATRGRDWGFRFLRSAGLDDPLGVYEETFAPIADERDAWCRVGGRVAVRFSDPDGRSDFAGRVIPHDFILIGGWARDVSSVADGIRLVWPLVEEEFAAIWLQPSPE